MNQGRVNLGRTVLAVVALGALGAVCSAGPALAGERSVPAGVRIAGVRVGGLRPGAAALAVRKAFERPLPLVVAGAKIELHPARFAAAYIKPAVGRARSSRPGTNIHLAVSVRGSAVRSAVAALARRFDRGARSAQLAFVGGRPVIKPQTDGEALDENALVARIERALASNVRRAVAVRPLPVKPGLTARSIGPVILINRALNRLTLYRPSNALWRTFPVATGQSIYPTPAGRFTIVVKQVNPWWYPPTKDAWAQGLSPVPPGPDNPLGTRWMGLSVSGVGIHGTDEPSSIGSNASHGCIRMQVVDSEWLFSHVKVGTTVFIV